MEIGFFGLLTLLFIAAKLFGAIAWSWVWVLSPLWIPTLIFLIVAMIFVAMIFVAVGSK